MSHPRVARPAVRERADLAPPAPGRARHLSRAARREGFNLLLVAAFTGCGFLLLHLRFSVDGTTRSDWLHDVHGRAIADYLPACAGRSALLVFGGAAVSIAAGALLGLGAAARSEVLFLRHLLRPVLVVPVVAWAYCFYDLFEGREVLAAVALGIGDFGIAAVSDRLYLDWAREVAKPYLRTLEMKGVPPLRHLARPMLVWFAEAFRQRLPHLVSALVIVESIFSIEGVGQQSIRAVTSMPPDLLVLGYIILGAVLAVRGVSALVAVLRAFLLPEPEPVFLTGRQIARGRPVRDAQAVRQPRLQRAEVDREGLRALDAEARARTGQRGPASGPAAAAGGRKRRWVILESRGWFRALRSYCRNGRGHAAGLGVSVLFCAGALLVMALAVLAPGDLSHPGSAPFGGIQPWRHWLGTNRLGMDVWGEVSASLRQLAVPLLLGVLLSVTVGGAAGLASGYYYRSLASRVTVAFFDTLTALPMLVVLLAAWGMLGYGSYLYKMVPIMGLLLSPLVFRHVHDRIRHLRGNLFVEAAVVRAGSSLSVVIRNLLRNHALPAVLVQATHVAAMIILLDAAMGYLATVGRLNLQQEGCYLLGALLTDGLYDCLSTPEANVWVLWGPLAVLCLITAAAQSAGDAVRRLLVFEGR